MSGKSVIEMSRNNTVNFIIATKDQKLKVSQRKSLCFFVFWCLSGKKNNKYIYPFTSASIILLCFLLFSLQLHAQNCDDLSLNTAKKKYENGNFDEVVSILSPCIKKEFSAQQQVEGYRLLSLSYIAMDSIDIALNSVSQLIRFSPNFEPNIFDPPKFIKLINDIKQEKSKNEITSVSKKSENIKEAPANVQLVTSDELKYRGYTDLEQVLHDLPGFDISRTNGLNYSSFYQRGYRTSNNNDRSIFLVDGIEENDVWSNNIWLSRQYSLTNMKRFEVIHGPASTMYGANAFVGVLNVVTKEVEDIIPYGKNFGVNGIINFGSYNSKLADITVAVKKNEVSLMVTARLFQSDEMDLSGYQSWDYLPNTLGFYRNNLSYKTTSALFRADTILTHHTDYFIINSDTSKLTLSDKGAALARYSDSLAYSKNINGSKIGFSDKTTDKYIYAKLKISNLTFGIEYWNTDEGGAWFTDKYAAGTENGNSWGIRQLAFYTKYEKTLSEKLFISNMLVHKIHDLDNKTALVLLKSYENGNLSLQNLIRGIPSYWQTTYYYQISQQTRNETKIIYQPTKDIDIISGFEFRYNFIQGNYITADTLNPSENGTVPVMKGGNNIKSVDLGLYTQTSYLIRSNLKFVFGARVDNNQIRETGGYGTQFNPRIVLIYTPGKAIFKAIYSEAFKDATNFDKFSTVPKVRDIPNPKLPPEKVRNYELIAGYDFGTGIFGNKNYKLFNEISGFRSNYSDVIGIGSVGGLLQNQANGQLEIYGAQLVTKLDYKNDLTILFNYSYTSPFNTKPLDSKGNLLTDASGKVINRLRIADIATHKFNLIVDLRLFKSFFLSTRVNFSGERLTGANTTVSTNPLTHVDSFFIVSEGITYTSKYGLSLQLGLNNIFNQKYECPGARNANGIAFASSMPQQGINFNVKIIYEFK